MFEYVLPISFSLAFSYIIIRILIPIAPKLGLIDIPGARKKHNGNIPLVGGLGIYTSVFLCTMLFTELQIQLLSIIALGGILTIIGTLDDKLGLSPRLRLVIQFFAGFLLAYSAGIELKSLGDIFGLGIIELGILSIPLTAIGVAALANAYNMTDGIDGLAASLGIVAFSFMLIAEYSNLYPSERLVLSFYICSLAIYLIFNFAIKPFAPSKVFMGDAGSMFIGFSIAAFAIHLTQSERFELKPVNVIWFVSVPLFDMIATMIRRMRKGQSPFYPDRTHLHHLLMHLGLSPKGSLAAIILFSISCSTLGLVLNNFETTEFVNFLCFTMLFALYLVCILKAWKLKKLLHKL